MPRDLYQPAKFPRHAAERGGPVARAMVFIRTVHQALSERQIRNARDGSDGQTKCLILLIAK
jgi:hypothetical protein